MVILWFKSLGKEKNYDRGKSGFKIIYEDILGNFGLLLCKERIFDEKSHFYHP